MKKICSQAAFMLLAFTQPVPNPARTMLVSDFLVQLNCSGPGCVSTTLPFPEPDAVSAAYPSPLTPNEQAAIYAPGNPALRGYDDSYAVVVGGNYIVTANGGREVEGRVAIGGNLIVNNLSYGMSQSGGGTFVIGAGGDTFPVAVNGSISGTGSLGIGFNRGGRYIVRSGGVNTLAVSGGGSVGQENVASQGSSGVDISAIISGMQTASTNMSATLATGTYSNGTFSGTGAAKEVFSVNNSDISDNLLYFEGIAPGATVVVNIKGSGDLNINWTAQIGRVGEPDVTDPDAQIYNVVFNFSEATNVNFNVPFIGTSLVPNGNAEVKMAFDGRLYISGNLVHSGEASEIHNYPFTGNLTPYEEPPLPVRLTSFQVDAGEGANIVKWTTSSEVDFSHFEIEHSGNAKEWSVLGSIVPEGSRTTKSTYQFRHIGPVPGDHYYRLKMVDADGSFEFSKIRNIHLDPDLFLTIYPNPVTAGFSLNGIYNPYQAPVEVDVVAPNGVLLKHYIKSSNAEMYFEMPKNLPKGTLLIRVSVPSGTNKALTLLNP